MNFETAAKTYHRALSRAARRMAGDDADDLVQNALLRAWRHWPDDVTGPWFILYQNLRWAWARMCEESGARKRVGITVDLTEAPEPSISMPQVAAAELARVCRDMEALRPEWRDGLSLVALGYTFKEIGEMRGVSGECIRQQVATARQHLTRGQARVDTMHSI